MARPREVQVDALTLLTEEVRALRSEVVDVQSKQIGELLKVVTEQNATQVALNRRMQEMERAVGEQARQARVIQDASQLLLCLSRAMILPVAQVRPLQSLHL